MDMCGLFFLFYCVYALTCAGTCAPQAVAAAEALYERAVLLSPLHVRALYNFGLFQEGVQHDQAKAELLYRTVLARSPAHTGALCQLAHLLQQDGRDVAGARELLDSAMEMEPTNLDALCLQALVQHVNDSDLTPIYTASNRSVWHIYS